MTGSGYGEKRRVRPGPIRLWFCFAVAVLAAAVADPCIEALSNAGVFGSGQFTDRSNLDVIPALIVGALLLATYFVLRVRRELLLSSIDAVREGVVSLLPATFAVQLGALCAMETIEQIAVYGHRLGGTVWLGGPVIFSLLAHAFACVGIAYALAAALRIGARKTARAIRLIRALLERALHGPAPLATRVREPVRILRRLPVLSPTGNRAPPVAIV